MANQLNSDIEEDPYALPDQPRDLTQRRKYATVAEEVKAMAPASEPSQKRNVNKRRIQQTRRVIEEDSDEEAELDLESEESSEFPASEEPSSYDDD